MPVAITNVKNQQDLEVVVSGPDTVTRRFIVSGIGETNLAGVAGQPHKEIYTALLGPVLTSAQFVRAMATASPAAAGFYSLGGGPVSAYWRIVNVDADFDDESGQVKLSIEAEVQAGGQTNPIIETVFPGDDPRGAVAREFARTPASYSL